LGASRGPLSDSVIYLFDMWQRLIYAKMYKWWS